MMFNELKTERVNEIFSENAEDQCFSVDNVQTQTSLNSVQKDSQEFHTMEKLQKQRDNSKEFDHQQRISSQNISCTITTYEKPIDGRYTAENILQYELRLKEAQRTVSNRDILIKMLHDQLKRFEDLYKKTIDENREVRLRYLNTVQELSCLKKQFKDNFKDNKTQSTDEEKNLKCIESLIEKQTYLLQKLTQDMVTNDSKNSFNQEEETQKEKFISTYEYSVSKTDYESNKTSMMQDSSKIKSTEITDELQFSKYLSSSIANNISFLTKNLKEISDKMTNLEQEMVELKCQIKSNDELGERVKKLEKYNEEQHEKKLQELHKNIEEINALNTKLKEENEKLKKQTPRSYNYGDSAHDDQVFYSPKNLSIKRSKSDQYVGNVRPCNSQFTSPPGYYVLNMNPHQQIPTQMQYKNDAEILCVPNVKGNFARQDLNEVNNSTKTAKLKLSKLQNLRMAGGEGLKADKNLTEHLIDGVPLKVYLNNLHEQLKIFSNIETAIEVLRKDLVLKLNP